MQQPNKKNKGEWSFDKSWHFTCQSRGKYNFSQLIFKHFPPYGSALCIHQLHTSGAEFTHSYCDGLYPGHIQTTAFQKALLAVGSGVAALHDPYRHGGKFIVKVHHLLCFLIFFACLLSDISNVIRGLFNVT